MLKLWEETRFLNPRDNLNLYYDVKTICSKYAGSWRSLLVALTLIQGYVLIGSTIYHTIAVARRIARGRSNRRLLY